MVSEQKDDEYENKLISYLIVDNVIVTGINTTSIRPSVQVLCDALNVWCISQHIYRPPRTALTSAAE